MKFVAIIIGLLLFTANFFCAKRLVDARVFIIFIPLVFSFFIFEIYNNNKNPFTNIAFSVLGIVYIALPFSLFNYFIFQGEQASEEDEIKQGEELGFIKFGSRVDIILPLDVEVKVKLDQIIVGKQTIIAEM